MDWYDSFQGSIALAVFALAVKFVPLPPLPSEP
jgi:hypothetical protein